MENSNTNYDTDLDLMESPTTKIDDLLKEKLERAFHKKNISSNAS